MVKFNKRGNALGGGVLLVLIIIAGIGAFMIFGDSDKIKSIGSGSGSSSLGGSCPDDGDTSLKIQVFNKLNATGTEGYDVTGYLYKKTSSGLESVASISDTTSPTATVVDCGFDYVFKPVATDGISGDNSRIKSVRSGPGSIGSDGSLEFSAGSSNVNIDVYMDQQATLNCKAYSNTDKASVYDDGDASATDYETDGVTWMSSSDNTTVYSESNGVDLVFSCRSTGTDTNFNDHGVVLLLELPTATWDTPAVWIDGNKVTDMKDNLNSDEAKAWSGYEYAFEFDKDILDGGEGVDIRVAYELAPGVSTASANPEFDIAVRGAYLSNNGPDVKIAGVKDDASQTVVRTIYDMELDIA